MGQRAGECIVGLGEKYVSFRSKESGRDNGPWGNAAVFQNMHAREEK